MPHYFVVLNIQGQLEKKKEMEYLKRPGIFKVKRD